MNKPIIANIQVDTHTRQELAQLMVHDCKAHNKTPKILFDINGQAISMYAADKNFKDAMDKADMIHADGMSVVFASRLFTKTPLPERIAVTDFFHDAAVEAEKSGISFYIFGASEDVNRKACGKLQQLYPTLKIAGRQSGYFSEADEENIIRQINVAAPDVLWVGLGRPRQELWVIKNRDRLNVKWIKICGGLLDFIASDSKWNRAPIWVQNIGMEWLYRLVRDPRRLFWRYLITNIHAVYLMVRYSK